MITLSVTQLERAVMAGQLSATMHSRCLCYAVEGRSRQLFVFSAMIVVTQRFLPHQGERLEEDYTLTRELLPFIHVVVTLNKQFQCGQNLGYF